MTGLHGAKAFKEFIESRGTRQPEVKLLTFYILTSLVSLSRTPLKTLFPGWTYKQRESKKNY